MAGRARSSGLRARTGRMPDQLGAGVLRPLRLVDATTPVERTGWAALGPGEGRDFYGEVLCRRCGHCVPSAVLNKAGGGCTSRAGGTQRRIDVDTEQLDSAHAGVGAHDTAWSSPGSRCAAQPARALLRAEQKTPL